MNTQGYGHAMALARRLIRRALAYGERIRRARDTDKMGKPSWASSDYTDSDIPQDNIVMDEEQQRALRRVTEIYHRGTQPLTVAKARYDLIRRGVSNNADDGQRT